MHLRRSLIKRKQFVSELFGKIKDNPLSSRLPLVHKKYGNSKYTIVSACYNVSAYLDDFFSSLIAQRLDFKNNIFCVMVDDGSTDDTAEKIKAWQRRYPENILYVRKENGGQADARNVGLQHVKTPWVTFIDPDDFVNPLYFYTIDKELSKKVNVCFVGENFIYFIENKQQFSDTHPLRFKFEADVTRVSNGSSNTRYIHLQSGSGLFSMDVIREHGLTFSTLIRPNFEDAHFIARYLWHTMGGSLLFLKDAKYFYRKRLENNSTIDRSWRDKRKFFDILQYGYLDLLQNYGDFPYVHSLILYDFYWYLKFFVNNPEKASFLTPAEVQDFLALCDAVFSHIQVNTIMRFGLAKCWFYYKVGMCHCFKNEDIDEAQIVYAEE
ncbi:MAG: glycosyltransferase family 2 protein, partial [Mailhella sp.]|nr:glycosyltransferase family 2 protein [Mailhella sp.]